MWELEVQGGPVDDDFGNREMARQRNPLFCISKWWNFGQGEGFDGDDDGALEAVCGGRCSVVSTTSWSASARSKFTLVSL